MNPLKQNVYKISAHRLNLFKECPFKLCVYLSHWEQGETDTTYINAGLAVHQYMEDLVAGHPQDVQYYIDKFKVVDSVVERVHTCIQNAKPYESLKGQTEVTKHTLFTTPKGRRVDLETRIDFLSDDGEVIDWKTGKHIDTEEYNRQMHIYLFAENFKGKATLVSLLTGEKVTISESPASYVPNLCDEYIDAIENHEFYRKRNMFCKRCECFSKYCAPGRVTVEIEDKKVY